MKLLDEAAQGYSRQATFFDGDVQDVITGDAARDALANKPVNHSQVVDPCFQRLFDLAAQQHLAVALNQVF